MLYNNKDDTASYSYFIAFTTVFIFRVIIVFVSKNKFHDLVQMDKNEVICKNYEKWSSSGKIS